MARQFTEPTSARVSGLGLERALQEIDRIHQNHAQVLREILAAGVVRAKLIERLDLEDGVVRDLAHGFERPCRVFWSPPTNSSSAGRIRDFRGTQVDQNRFVRLRADGYGATIQVDLLLVPAETL